MHVLNCHFNLFKYFQSILLWWSDLVGKILVNLVKIMNTSIIILIHNYLILTTAVNRLLLQPVEAHLPFQYSWFLLSILEITFACWATLLALLPATVHLWTLQVRFMSACLSLLHSLNIIYTWKSIHAQTVFPIILGCWYIYLLIAVYIPLVCAFWVCIFCLNFPCFLFGGSSI